MRFSNPEWWPRLQVTSEKIDNNLFKTLLRQQNIQNGLLISSSLNLAFVHSEKEIINDTINKFNNSMAEFSEIVNSKNPKAFLKGEVIKPTFKVR